jgi:hypothetical protein
MLHHGSAGEPKLDADCARDQRKTKTHRALSFPDLDSGTLGARSKHFEIEAQPPP